MHNVFSNSANVILIEVSISIEISANIMILSPYHRLEQHGGWLVILGATPARYKEALVIRYILGFTINRQADGHNVTFELNGPIKFDEGYIIVDRFIVGMRAYIF